jgi:hypothetical protein
LRLHHTTVWLFSITNREDITFVKRVKHTSAFVGRDQSKLLQKNCSFSFTDYAFLEKRFDVKLWYLNTPAVLNHKSGIFQRSSLLELLLVDAGLPFPALVIEMHTELAPSKTRSLYLPEESMFLS